ncbi:MAG: type IVB secretion system protein IcmH/DotU [Ignavibacteriaceae bacterium]
MADNQLKEKKTLADFASDCFILILQLRATNDYGDPSALKNHINEMFGKFERDARMASIDNEKIHMAKFALIAFLDETIISSSWNQKDTWLSEPLQLKLFETFNAGEEFFDHLKKLRQRTSGNKDVLEIFFLCLTLGFKGKYQLQSPENLRRIIDDLNIELHPDLYKLIDTISPNGKPHDSFIGNAKGKIPLWIYPAAAVIICVIFYIFMSSSISSRASDLIEVIKNSFI